MAFFRLGLLFLTQGQAKNNGAGNDSADNCQRPLNRHVEPGHGEHFSTDEYKDDCQAIFKQVKPVSHVGKQELQRTQTHDGKDI